LRKGAKNKVADRAAFFPVDFDNFQRVLNRPGGFRDPGEPEEYCRGFQVFDKELTGFIGVGQFRYILTNLGEKMSDEEVDELLKAVDTSSGELNYMGESLYMCPWKTRILTAIFCRYGQDDSRKLGAEGLIFPFCPLYFSRHETKLARILALMGRSFAREVGKKVFVISEAEKEASERRSLAYRPGTRWSGLFTCIQQSRALLSSNHVQCPYFQDAAELALARRYIRP